jgi:hypothetical protein
MPLLDYISGDEDEREGQIAAFIFERASDVSDDDSMDKVRDHAEYASWYWDGFNILDSAVDGNDGVRAHFSFKMTGWDKEKRQAVEVINGTALVLISAYDDVEFADVLAELTLVD